MLSDTFCNVPWFHIEIEQNGDFEYCCWSDHGRISRHNITSSSFADFFNSEALSSLRKDLLDGKPVPACNACHRREAHGQISGRLISLEKSGILQKSFGPSLVQSPHLENFKYSLGNIGRANTKLGFLKVNLSDTCNSACMYCDPKFSRKMQREYQRINWKVNGFTPSPDFVDDPQGWQNLLKLIKESNLWYLQILGGETLYTKKFYQLVDYLIDQGIASNLHLGITTNGTIYDEDLLTKLENFQRVDIGVSVDCFHPVNDYVRWPSKIDQVTENFLKFLNNKPGNVFLLIRSTPNIFSIFHYDTIIEFCLANGVYSETCNILSEPTWQRIELLPPDLKNQIAEKIRNKILQHDLVTDLDIKNQRSDRYYKTNIGNYAHSYLSLLESDFSEDTEKDLDTLVSFLRKTEPGRGIKILDYLPEYERFLRSIGY
jgi:MoaA/NifB/PqqE/SkfB family radical SAM enzyme